MQELENIQVRSKKSGTGTATTDLEDSADEDEDDDDDPNVLIQLRNDFVRRAIEKREGQKASSIDVWSKMEATMEERRAVIAEFMAIIPKQKECNSCKG
jgi:hypothetical protein